MEVLRQSEILELFLFADGILDVDKIRQQLAR